MKNERKNARVCSNGKNINMCNTDTGAIIRTKLRLWIEIMAFQIPESEKSLREKVGLRVILLTYLPDISITICLVGSSNWSVQWILASQCPNSSIYTYIAFHLSYFFVYLTVHIFEATDDFTIIPLNVDPCLRIASFLRAPMDSRI